MPSRTPSVPHPSLDFGRRLLLSGASPDVFLHALAQGWVDTALLWEPLPDGRHPLVEWLRTAHPGPSVAEACGAYGPRPDFQWPVATNPGMLPSRALSLAQSAAWHEYLLCELVRLGLDPLTLIPGRASAKPKAPSLLEWAARHNRPWLLDTCLGRVPAHSRAKLIAQPVVITKGHQEMEAPRVHAALAQGNALVAHVWVRHGADPLELACDGRQAISFAASAQALSWALDNGNDLARPDHKGVPPCRHWRSYASAAELGEMEKHASVLEENVGLGLLEQAITLGDVARVATLADANKSGVNLLPSGRTPLGVAAIWGLGAKGKSDRAAASKILAHLWPRANLQAAHECASNGLSDLELAAVASSALDPCARRAWKRIRFPSPTLPPPGRVAKWAGSQLDPADPLGKNRLALLCSWLAARALEEAQAGQHDTSMDFVESVVGLAPLIPERLHGSLSTSVWAAATILSNSGPAHAEMGRLAGLVFQILDASSQAECARAVEEEFGCEPGQRLASQELEQKRKYLLARPTDSTENALGNSCLLALDFIGRGHVPDQKRAIRMLENLNGCGFHPIIHAALPVLSATCLKESWDNAFPSPSSSQRPRM